MATPPGFYNLGDQAIYSAGDFFIPQERFRAAPYNANTPTAPDDPAAAGLPAVYRPQGSGGGGGDYAASLGLGPDTRGYIGNYQDINFDDMYSYTPQGIMVEDFTKPFVDERGITGKRVSYQGDQSGYIKPAPKIFEPKQQNMFQKAFGKGFDLAKTAGSGLISLATGIPFAGSLLEKGLGAISSQFTDRPLGAAVIDEFGNVYDEEELNRQNALGGYYTDAARSARRRTSRIANMIERQRMGKKISEANLAKLLAQEKAQEAARQAAADAMQAENKDKGTGGYQSSFAQDSDFMEGPSGAGTGLGASDKGGSDTMGSFMDGGIVDLVDIYD